MAKLVYVAFPVVLLLLWGCGGRSHAHEDHNTPPHPQQTPTHAHTLGRWAGVPGRNLSCGDLTEVVRLATIIVDLIDEFKDSYTQAALGGLTWDEINEYWPIAYDYSSIKVCLAGDRDCMSVLHTLPPHNPPQHEEEVKALMVVMTGFLQRYAVAAETLVLDQSLSENERGFLNDMVDVQTHLEELIEVFQLLMTSCDLTPNPKLVIQLSHRMHKRENEDVRDLRGFTGLRQIRLGLLFLADMFSEPQPDTSRSLEGVQGQGNEEV